MKNILTAIAVAILLGVTVYFCNRKESAAEIPSGVQALTSVSQLNPEPDHLVVVGFGVASETMQQCARQYDGAVEFFLADSTATSVMREMGVETLPAVRFIHKKSASAESLIGNFNTAELSEMIGMYVTMIANSESTTK